MNDIKAGVIADVDNVVKALLRAIDSEEADSRDGVNEGEVQRSLR